MTAGRARRVAVLAGGRGSRLGVDKPNASIAGRPLYCYVTQAARDADLEPVLVAKPGFVAAPDPIGVAAPAVLHEPEQPVHALLGVVSALEALAEPVVVCPCDMPFVTADLLAWLAADPRDALVLEHDGRVQPLVGRYSPLVLERLRMAVDEGTSATTAAAQLGAATVTSKELAACGDPARMLLDVDTPEDLARAEAMLGGDLT